MTTKEDIKLRLTDLGWEVRMADTGAVVGGSGKRRVMVSFDEIGGEPTSVIIAHVGRGGEILSGKWRGLRGLPSPERAARTLSK